MTRRQKQEARDLAAFLTLAAWVKGTTVPELAKALGVRLVRPDATRRSRSRPVPRPRPPQLDLFGALLANEGGPR